MNKTLNQGLKHWPKNLQIFSYIWLFILISSVSTSHTYQLYDFSWPQPSASFHVDIPGENDLWNDAFEDAMYEWNVNTIFQYSIVSGTYSNPCDASDNKNGVGFDSTNCGDAWGSTTLAITQSWYIGTTTTETNIVFNSNEPWDVYSGPWLNHVSDFRRVAVHELGHALGLRHEDSGISTIMKTYATDTSSPQQDDINGVETLYGGLIPEIKVNLTPYRPDGWSDKIVTSTTTNTNIFYITDTIYIDWAIINDSSIDAESFKTTLYLDGNNIMAWNYTDLKANQYSFIRDFSIGTLSTGTHTIKIEIDSNNDIIESNEEDNEYSKTINISDPSINIAAFITRFYQQCLNREPDTEGLNYWVNSLNNGDQKGDQLAEAFIFSQEFQNRNTSDSAFVTILYKAFFNRDPDTGGYNNWINRIEDGASRSSILDGFTSAQEFITLCQNYGITATSTSNDPTVQGFVTRFYQQCLNREPDVEGLENWINSLNNGVKTGKSLANAFIFSTEFQNRNTSDSDFITILYKAFFNRDPDRGGYNNWINRMENGASRSSVLDGFTSVQEFINLCKEYNVLAN